VRVNFDFIGGDPVVRGAGTITALFTLNAVSTGAIARNADTGTISQGMYDGAQPAAGFSFRSADAFTANGVTKAAGTNLLSASFTNAVLSAEENDTAASFRNSTPGTSDRPKTISYTSDLLRFDPAADNSFSFSLDALSPRAGAKVDSFGMFSAIAGGTMSAASTAAVPEPGTWATMLIGFAAVGMGLRRSRVRPRLA